ncbi:hypothetical protein EMCRGX_G006452 [Ephydatia muelleri]
MVTGPLYFWTQWPHDPNLTINVLLQVVLSHFQNLKQLSRPLPEHLCLQLDNTARENKNRCVLSFSVATGSVRSV